MENVNEMNNPEIYDTRAKLEAIHHDFKRLIEKSNQEYLDLLLANLKKDFLNSITYYVANDRKRPRKSMVDPFKMRELCKSRFTEFLGKNADIIRRDNVLKCY